MQVRQKKNVEGSPFLLRFQANIISIAQFK